MATRFLTALALASTLALTAGRIEAAELSPADRFLIADALDRLPQGTVPERVSMIKRKLYSGIDVTFSLPEFITLGLALTRMDTPEAIALRDRIQRQIECSNAGC